MKKTFDWSKMTRTTKENNIKGDNELNFIYDKK